MSAVGFRLRAELRRDWRSLLVVSLLVALAGGACLASLAAARRTSTAFSRMRSATDAWDVMVNPNNGSESALTMAELRRVPGIERIARIDGMILYPSIVRSVPDAFNLPPILVDDAGATYRIGRPIVTAGRQPAADDPNGVFVEQSFARSMHLHVGQTFHYVVLAPALLQQLQSASSEAAAAATLRAAPASQQGTARIDGIGVTQDGVVVNPGYVPAAFIFTPAFRAAHPDLVSPYWGAMVKLKPGVDVDTFTARVAALAPNESIAFQRASAVGAEVENATDPEVLALEAFAALAALFGLVVVAQSLSRRMQVDAAYNATLAAIGSTRRDRMTVSMAKALVAIAVGALIAIAIAVAASPLGPVGAVRVAEVHPGIAVDWTVLGLGALAVVVVGAALAVVPAWRSSHVAGTETANVRSRLADSVAAAGGSVTSVLGVRFALERGGGRSSFPVRTTLVAAATAVALVTSVVVFSGSLDHLLATPRLYGTGWDAQIELDNLNTPAGFNDLDSSALANIEKTFVHVADHSGSVADSALLEVGEVRSGAVSIPAIGYARSLRGVAPTISAGRPPRARNEVALGATTMARLHTHVGATVELAEQERGRDRPVRVVGEAVLPGLGPYPGSDKAGLGVGALFDRAGWRRFSPDFQKIDYVFRWAPGASTATLTRAFARQMPSQLPLTVSAVNRPSGVVSAQRLRSTPTLLASLLAVLLAAAVANTLVVTIRRRRRELAILRSLGCTTSQLTRTVLWQSTTIAAFAVLLGIPAGVIIGRWTWRVLADRLGAISVPEVSTVALVAVAVAVIVLANVVGVIPGLRAARAPGARCERSERTAMSRVGIGGQNITAWGATETARCLFTNMT